MEKRLKIDGAVVLITGAGHGIGLAILRETIRRGGIPVAVDHNPEATAALKSLVGEKGTLHQADVCDAHAMETVVQETCSRFGGIDIIIANAGIERIDPIEDMAADAFESVIETNLLGVYRTLKPALKSVVKRKGHIVALSSISALIPFPLAAAYSTSKAGVAMLMRVLRMELNGTGATAGVCFFGFVETQMANRIFSEKLLVRALNRFHAPLLGTWPQLTPEHAATKVLDGIEKRKARIFAPPMARLTYWLQGLYAALDDIAAKHTMRRGNLIYQLRWQKRQRTKDRQSQR